MSARYGAASDQSQGPPGRALYRTCRLFPAPAGTGDLMSPRIFFWRMGWVCFCAGATLTAQNPPPPSQQTPPPAFRSGTTLVPVDVRVLDPHRNTGTHLTQNDF